MSDTNPCCPRCGSRRIVIGELTPGRSIGPTAPLSFRAYASQFSAIRKGAKIDPGVAACSQCGLVWGEVKVTRLFEHLESFPTDDLADWLRSSNNTPV
jgi:transcription elongation factor Elf1